MNAPVARARWLAGHVRWVLLTAMSISLLMPAARSADVAIPPSSDGKLIALSFDDVPRGAGAFMHPDERAGRLLTALQRHQVPQVAFYVNPGRMGAGPGTGVRLDAYAAAGNVIANHSWTHPRLSKMAVEPFLADVDRAEAWLKGRAGYRPWFRFPFLDEGGADKVKRDAIRAGLSARGLRHAYVTIDGSDWNIEGQALRARAQGKPIDMTALRDLYVETHVESAEFTERLTRATLGRSARHVLLLHETDIAALFLGDLVKALRAKGWTLVSNDRAMADPIYARLPDTAHAGGTLAEMLAWEKGIKGPRWYERNEIKLADRLFRERVLHER